MMEACEHIEKGKIDLLKFRNYEECVECRSMEDWWVFRNTCMDCGGTRCCDSSPNKHASNHWKDSGHHVILGVNQMALWCYKDDGLRMLDEDEIDAIQKKFDENQAIMEEFSLED